MVFTGMGDSGASIAVEVTGRSDDFDATMGSAIGRLFSLRGAALAAGTALGALGVDFFATAIDAARSFEEEMVEIEKVIDPAETNIAALTAGLGELAVTMPVAGSELRGLAADAARFGIQGSENILEFVRVTAMMATATNLTAETAGVALARLATLTETPISSINNLGSAINTLGQNFATTEQDIVNASLRSAGALTQLGLSAPEIFGLNAALAAVSESSDRAGSRLRVLAQFMLDPNRTEKLADALGMTVEEFREMRSEAPLDLIRQMITAFDEGGTAMEDLSVAIGREGSTALTGLSANVEETERALALANEQFDEGTSLSAEFAKASQTFNAELTKTENVMSSIYRTAGTQLLPALTDLIVTVRDGLMGFRRLNSATDGWAAIAVGATAVTIGLASAFGLLALTAGTPVALAVGGIVALGAAVAGFAFAYETNMLGVRNITNSVLTAVGQMWDNTFAHLTGVTSREIATLLGDFENLTLGLEEFADTALTMFTTVGDAVVRSAEAWGFALTQVTAARGALLAGDLEGAIDIVRGIAPGVEERNQAVREMIDERSLGLANRRNRRRNQMADLIQSPLDIFLGRTAADVPIDEGLSEFAAGAGVPDAGEGAGGVLAESTDAQVETAENTGKLLDAMTPGGRTGPEGLLDPFDRISPGCVELVPDELAAVEGAITQRPTPTERAEMPQRSARRGQGLISESGDMVSLTRLENAVERGASSATVDATLDGKSVSRGVREGEDRYVSHRFVE